MPPQKPPPTRPSIHRILLPAVILLLAALYKIYLHDILPILFSFGRVVQPLEDFPYECHQLKHPLVSGCEDIWLDSSGRKLYAACADIESRKGWCPGANKLNVSARKGSDWISVLDIDKPGPDGLYGVRKLKVEETYKGDLDLLGFDVKEVDGALRFWLINHRPPVDLRTGEVLEAENVGANSTIEVFDLDRASETLQHVKTIISDAIVSPNNLAVAEDGNAFLITNDHARKFGLLKRLELLTGGGSVAHCRTDSGECRIVDQGGFYMPNGIARGKDGVFYVVHAGAGKLSVHELVDGELRRIGEVDTGIGMDNLSVDSEGNIIVPGVPDIMGFLKAFDQEGEVPVAATVLRIKKTGEAEGKPQYGFEKMIEDKEGRMLSTTTVAAHDVESKRLFAAGLLASYITVCQRV